MTKHDLVREELIIPDTPAELLGEPEVWEEAAKVLSYRGGQVATTALQHQTAFRTLLKQMNVKPFTPASVARYQRAQQRKMWWSANWFRCVLAAAPLLSALTALAVSVQFVTSSSSWYGLAVLAVCAGSAASVGVAVNLRWARFRWERISLRDYAEPIPAAVIQLALALEKGRVPQTFFLIEVLGERSMLPRELLNGVRSTRPDPFLIFRDARSGSEAYIAVWDEPSFKADVA